MLLVLLACTDAPSNDSGTTDSGTESDTSADSSADTGESGPAILSVEWLSPASGATVAAGDVACALIVEGFVMESNAKHNDGEPEGYVRITVDGVEAKLVASTNFSLSLAAGSPVLGAQLFYGDGDAVYATHDAVCEDIDDEGCLPILSEVGITVSP